MSILKKAAITLACLAFFAVGAHASAGNVYISQSATGANAPMFRRVSREFLQFVRQLGIGLESDRPRNHRTPLRYVHRRGRQHHADDSGFRRKRQSGHDSFESGAVFAAPYWGGGSAGSAGPGAIQCSGYSYITIDGGANGIIENTANGSASLGFANQQGSTGVFATNCPHFTVQGSLSVINIFMHAENDPVTNATGGTSAIWVQDSDGISITGATINNAFVPLNVGYDPGSPITSGNRRTQYHR